MYSSKKTGSYRSAYLDQLMSPAPKPQTVGPTPEQLYRTAQLSEEERAEAKVMAQETRRYYALRRKAQTKALTEAEQGEFDALRVTINSTFGGPNTLRNVVRRKLHRAMAELAITNGG